MRFVPTRIHGIVGWLLGALLIALPWLLGFARGGPETYVASRAGFNRFTGNLFHRS